ncbi:hypothetical protein G7K_4612-t1 [Saitoella complicata NRRL Y-17804]|uniref:Uncharacterized protein n=1 Tax=Saitoella complicata (strain BCRC 22490 / CBS 7301 / JCM 7358 / NBRC 10748 / NRRL Y-17804) TaxID=698492 RepID=A0A0E9NL13_SAICN|nr:hypothetical protein G7K_4612-t1 [Saitoella complicata NRRL Y-17804]
MRTFQRGVGWCVIAGPADKRNRTPTHTTQHTQHNTHNPSRFTAMLSMRRAPSLFQGAIRQFRTTAYLRDLNPGDKVTLKLGKNIIPVTVQKRADPTPKSKYPNEPCYLVKFNSGKETIRREATLTKA